MKKIMEFKYPTTYSKEIGLCIHKMQAHIIAGYMLFPDAASATNLRAYVSLCMNDVFEDALVMGMHINEIFSELYSHIKIFVEDDELRNVPVTMHQQLIWKNYQNTLSTAQFPERGKGSLQERFMRGIVSGALANNVLKGGLSLAQAAKGMEEVYWAQYRTIESCKRDALPTMTAANIMQNIWPTFKNVAHIWAAMHDFDLTEYEPGKPIKILDLYKIRDAAIIVNPNPKKYADAPQYIDVKERQSKYNGILGLLDKSNQVLDESAKRGILKQSTKPFFDEDECIRFVLPEVKKHEPYDIYQRHSDHQDAEIAWITPLN